MSSAVRDLLKGDWYLMLKEGVVQIDIEPSTKWCECLHPLDCIRKLHTISSFDGLEIPLCQVDLNDLT
jgi:hypothetical protein